MDNEIAKRVLECVKKSINVQNRQKFPFCFTGKPLIFAGLNPNWFIRSMKKHVLLAIALIFGAAFLRLLDHPMNFTPMGAIALFAGALIPNRILAFAIPIVALLITDSMLGFYGWQMLLPYSGFLITILLGRLMRDNQHILRVGSLSVLSSVLFYLITNFAFFYPETLYPHTTQGILQSYIAAIPFFQNGLAGDLFFNGLLFGAYYLIRINVPSFKQA